MSHLTASEITKTLSSLDPHDLRRMYAHARLEMNRWFTAGQTAHTDNFVDTQKFVSEQAFKQ